MFTWNEIIKNMFKEDRRNSETSLALCLIMKDVKLPIGNDTFFYSSMKFPDKTLN
jgi:hypothetical protein